MNLSKSTYGVMGLIALGSISVSSADDPPEPRAVMPEKHFSIFEKYCLDCHDTATEKGEVNLEELSFAIDSDIQTAERWQKILDALNTGEMPPEDKAQLTPEEKTIFLEDLSLGMVTARRVLSDSGGNLTLRRLNRREYQNTLEALLGVRPDVSNLPDDQASVAGFDTAGASLFFSSDQLEQYLAAAKGALGLALMPGPGVKPKTVRIEPEEEYTPQYERAAAELGDRVAQANAFFAQKEKPATEFGFLDEYAARKSAGNAREWVKQLEWYLERPETKTGATFILTIKEGGYTKVKLPTLHEGAGGRYTMRIRAAAYPEADERFHYLEFSSGFGTGRNHLGWRKVTGTLENPEIIEFTYDHPPGERSSIWIHQRSHQDRGDKNLWTIDQKENGLGTTPGLWVDWAELIGPVPDPRPAQAAARILLERPEDWADARYAREVLQRFATLAFRGKDPAPEWIDRLMTHYAASLAKGRTLTEALVEPMAIVLASPSFLYLVEPTDATAPSKLSGEELAVRLSYFLWSAPPDEELLRVAKSGRLSEPEMLRAQTERLLSDARVDRFVHGFVHQWLELDRLDMFQFDGVKFPTFDNAVRAHAREEIFRTFQYLLESGKPLPSLLKADFVVINDLLAGYYGLPDVKGHEFRPVSVPGESLRGGLLGTAAVLAMGSDGQRSSPVERGVWVLRKLLNNPPPPAPPNVPMLNRFDGNPLGARELARAHQEEPQCAQCHQKIDPVGLGLENFDAAGLWRELEPVSVGEGRKAKTTALPIDPGGQLPGGKKFADYFGLRDGVAAQSSAFEIGFTEELIAYALGRPFGFSDELLAEDVVQHAQAAGNSPSEFIHAIVQSKTFHTK